MSEKKWYQFWKKDGSGDVEPDFSATDYLKQQMARDAEEAGGTTT